MDTMQEILEKTIEETFTEDFFVFQLLEKKIEEKGIVLNKKQKDKLRDTLKKGISSDFIFHINEDEALECPEHLRDKSVSIEFDEEKDVDDIYKAVSETLESTIPKISTRIARSILKTLRGDFRSHQRERQAAIGNFKKNLKKDWRKPLDLLEMFCFIASDAGEAFTEHFRALVTKENDIVFDVLARLHARSCQISSEILCLLKNGFADGAHARWRTLHEIAVVSRFISKYGNELAERYACHESLEYCKATIKYQQDCDAQGEEKLDDESFRAIKHEYDSLVNKFGPDYKNSYGWASEVVGIKKPRFADIEACVELAFMRPHYKKASHNVHANPEGVFFRLGLIPENEGILLAGPSNIGLVEPGRSAAYSFLNITTDFLFIESNLDRLVIVEILSILATEISEAFYLVQDKLEEE